jgi:hypothetical protein
MKRLFCFIYLFAIVLLTVNAQKDAGKNSKAPMIKFDNMEYNYGVIYQGDNGVTTFKFKNTGKEPLIITNATASCGCTIPEKPDAPIMPGKTGVIKVKYDTARTGPINRTIHVLSNATDSDVVLTIKGEVKPKPVEQVPVNTSNSLRVN